MTKYHRVEDIFADVETETDRRRAVADWRSQVSAGNQYGRPAEAPTISPRVREMVRRQVVRYSEESLKPGSPTPAMKTLETMTPEERAAMVAQYGPLSPTAEWRVQKYDEKRRPSRSTRAGKADRRVGVRGDETSDRRRK